MKIAVVSDIHGNLLALEAVVRDFASQGVGAVVNLGDSVSGPLMPLETAQYLMAQNWHHLAGNHERQLLNMTDKSGASDKFAHARLGVAELNWLATLTHSHQLLPDVLLCHGTPTSDCTSLLQTAERNATREEVEFS